MKKEMEEVLDEYAAQNFFYKRVLTSQQEFMDKAREWTTILYYYYIEASAAIQQ